MGLDNEALKNLAKEISTENKNEKETTCYGEVQSKTEDEVMVMLDGSTVMTPATCAMDAEEGDKVICEIKDHKAVVSGNTTAPATGRSKNTYIRPVDDGFIIGKNDSDVGSVYLFLDGDSYAIMKQNGSEPDPANDDKVADFIGDGIQFLDGKAEIGVSNDGQFLEIISGRWLSLGVKDGSANVSLIGDTLLLTGISIPAQMSIDSKSASSVSVSANGYTIVEVPITPYTIGSDFKLKGIVSIRTNHRNVCQLTEFGVINAGENDAIVPAVYATFHNSSSSAISDLQVDFKYLYANES